MLRKLSGWLSSSVYRRRERNGSRKQRRSVDRQLRDLKTSRKPRGLLNRRRPRERSTWKRWRSSES